MRRASRLHSVLNSRHLIAESKGCGVGQGGCKKQADRTSGDDAHGVAIMRERKIRGNDQAVWLQAVQVLSIICTGRSVYVCVCACVRLYKVYRRAIFHALDV